MKRRAGPPTRHQIHNRQPRLVLIALNTLVVAQNPSDASAAFEALKKKLP